LLTGFDVLWSTNQLFEAKHAPGVAAGRARGGNPRGRRCLFGPAISKEWLKLMMAVLAGWATAKRAGIGASAAIGSKAANTYRDFQREGGEL